MAVEVAAGVAKTVEVAEGTVAAAVGNLDRLHHDRPHLLPLYMLSAK